MLGTKFQRLMKKASKIARESSRRSDENRARLDAIESRIEKLSLITESLWEIIRESGVSEDELAEKISVVTSEKESRAKEKLDCAECGMKVSAKRKRCMYCGGELVGDSSNSPFDN